MATEAQKITYAEVAAPSTPAANKVVVYAKADGLMYSKDDAGTETLLSGGAAATRASLGLDTTDSPQFAGVNVGHASDTTLTRASAGVLAVEGTNLVKAGAITGSGLTQATARILGRTTASTGAVEEITVGTGLSLAAGSLTATGGGAPTKHGATVYNSGGSTLTGSTETLILFDAEQDDTDAYHDTGSNTGRLTVPTGLGGIYAFCYTFRLTSNANAGDYVTIYESGTSNRIAMQQLYGGLTHHVCGITPLAQAEYLVVYINCASVNVEAANNSTLQNRNTFSMYLIGA